MKRLLVVALGAWALLSGLGAGMRMEEASCLPGGVSFATQADLDGDGLAEIVVGTAPGGGDGWFCSPGDLYIFTVAQEGGPWRYEQVFQARASLPEEFLTYFFLPTLRTVQDIDEDGLPEVIVVWLEEHWWPTAIHPFAVVQYSQRKESYEMAIDTRVKVSELGEFVLEDVDRDELIEIIQFEAVWEAEECHWCSHRYQIEVFEFDGEGFTREPNCNGGRPFITEEMFQPGFGESPIAEFLPQLMEYIHFICTPAPGSLSRGWLKGLEGGSDAADLPGDPRAFSWGCPRLSWAGGSTQVDLC